MNTPKEAARPTEAGLIIRGLDALRSAGSREGFGFSVKSLTVADRRRLLGIDGSHDELLLGLWLKGPSFLAADLATLNVSFMRPEDQESLERLVSAVVTEPKLFIYADTALLNRVFEKGWQIPNSYLATADLLLTQADVPARDRSSVIKLMADLVDLQSQIASNDDLEPEVRAYILKHLGKMIAALPNDGSLVTAVDFALGEVTRRGADLIPSDSRSRESLAAFFRLLERCLLVTAATQQVLELPATVQRMIEGS